MPRVAIDLCRSPLASGLRTAVSMGFLAGTALFPIGSVRAQTSYPMLLNVYPNGCRVGSTAELRVTGQGRIATAYAAWVSGEGVKVELVPAPADKAATQAYLDIKVTAAPDAALGAREIRLVTPSGVSTVGQLVIGREPELMEKEDNNSREKANAVTFPATLNGKLQAAEDLDFFSFQAEAGQEITFSCLSSRLQDKIHDLNPGGGGAHSDPMLVILDSTGRELAEAQDYWGPDPLLSHRFDRAGTYHLLVRDVRFSGNPGWTYRITSTSEPYLTNIFPLAGKRGEMTSLEPIGFNVSKMGAPRMQAPTGVRGATWMQIPSDAGPSNPVPFVVSDLDQLAESGENDTPASATPFEIPRGINGRMEKAGDVDCYRFAGVKGRIYSFEVFARRFGSRLDPILNVLDERGRSVGVNDDAPTLGKDSRLDWTCPDNGDYVVQVTDLHSAGGAPYVYYLEATDGRPDFTLQCDDDKALIGPGSGYAMYVQSTRRNGLNGDIRLSVENLPTGVTVTADRIPAGMDQACIIFRAPADAKPDFRAIRVLGTAEIPGENGAMETLRRVARPMQETYLPGGGRRAFPVDSHIASVTGPSDVLVKVSATELVLTPGESATLDVEVIRQNGYNKNVVLDVYLRHLGGKFGDPLPKGVTLDESQSKTLLGPTDTRGRIVLRAAATVAPIERLPIAVLGQVSINFVVKVSHAGDPVFLSVRR